MRLIRTGPYPPGPQPRLELHDIELHELQLQNQQYAILSHTWGELKDEILFADLANTCDSEIRQNFRYISVDLTREPGLSLKKKPAWNKIETSLDQARRDGLQWLWADTLCIDKGSSAELSEAINSMYTWYSEAAICYAYLADVSSRDPPELRRERFYNNRWFTRGWTLQELLAPKQLLFYSTDQISLGNKRSLAEPLSTITGIDVAILKGERTLESASVAKRMSWAAHRKTSRPEDRAYSLMGLFNVNMPMLYGEGGPKAFLRLQEEIMKLSDDQSIFAWVTPQKEDSIPSNTDWKDATATDQSPASDDRYHGLLAESPEAFAQAGDYRTYHAFEEQSPFDMSNRGLSISLHLTPVTPGIYIAALNCPVPATLDGFLGIYIKKLETGARQYARIRSDQLASLHVGGRLEQIFVRASVPELDAWSDVMPVHLFHIQRMGTLGEARLAYEIIDVFSAPFDEDEMAAYHDLNVRRHPRVPASKPGTFKMIKGDGRVTAALLLGRPVDDERFALLIGCGKNFEVGFDLVECEELTTLEAFEERFEPRALGRTLSLRYHNVNVKAETLIKSGVKVYNLAIYIEGIEKTHTETITEGIANLVGVKKEGRMSKIKQLF